MQLNDIYRGITRVQIGDGSTALFWKDLWLDEIIADTHPRAFSYNKIEDASVAEFLGIEDISQGFHLPLSAQAYEEVQDMQLLTASTSPDNATRDKWVCTWGESFSSAKYYKFYFKDVTADKAFVWIWKSACTMKLKVFAWLILADRINTKNMLSRRHFNVGDNMDCVLCDSGSEETVEHLFFTCPFSKKCWEDLQMTWLSDGNRLNLIHSARDGWSRPMFMEVFTTAAWGIWKKRNGKICQRIPPTHRSWINRFKLDFALLAHRAKPRLGPFIDSLISTLV